MNYNAISQFRGRTLNKLAASLIPIILLLSAFAQANPPASVRKLDDAVQMMGGELPFPPTELLKNFHRIDTHSDLFTTLIPHGRSLERFFTDYAQPRSIVAWVNKAASTPYYLFFGYTPRLEQLEIISWNWETRQFDFSVVKDYAAGKKPKIEPANRALCLACHQQGGPIFPVSPWQETAVENSRQGSVLKRLRATPALEPFASALIHRNALDYVKVETESLDAEVRNANDLLKDQNLFRKACGSDLNCRKNSFLANLLGATRQAFSYFGAGGAQSLLDIYDPASQNAEFQLPNDVLAAREVDDSQNVYDFTFEQDPLMPRPLLGASLFKGTEAPIQLFEKMNPFNREEAKELKGYGPQLLAQIVNSAPLESLLKVQWPPTTQESLRAVRQLVHAPENFDLNKIITPAPVTNISVTAVTHAKTSGGLFKFYCADCHGGESPPAPKLDLKNLYQLRIHVGYGGRTAYDLLSPGRPLMPPAGAPQPTAEERDAMRTALSQSSPR